MKSDPLVARQAIAAIKHELPLFRDDIKLLIHEGRVTLEGQVELYAQRDLAETLVSRLEGVSAVNNLIKVKPRIALVEVKRRIEDALRRSAAAGFGRISVHGEGNEVVLRGKVDCWFVRKEAEHAAWSAPGVSIVRNELVVAPQKPSASSPRQQRRQPRQEREAHRHSGRPENPMLLPEGG